MRMVVDLPAPLAPRKPKISPSPTSKLTSSTATNLPNRRVRCWTSMADMASPSQARASLASARRLLARVRVRSSRAVTSATWASSTSVLVATPWR